MLDVAIVLLPSSADRNVCAHRDPLHRLLFSFSHSLLLLLLLRRFSFSGIKVDTRLFELHLNYTSFRGNSVNAVSKFILLQRRTNRKHDRRMVQVFPRIPNSPETLYELYSIAIPLYGCQSSCMCACMCEHCRDKQRNIKKRKKTSESKFPSSIFYIANQSILHFRVSSCPSIPRHKSFLFAQAPSRSPSLFLFRSWFTFERKQQSRGLNETVETANRKARPRSPLVFLPGSETSEQLQMERGTAGGLVESPARKWSQPTYASLDAFREEIEFNSNFCLCTRRCCHFRSVPGGANAAANAHLSTT